MRSRFTLAGVAHLLTITLSLCGLASAQVGQDNPLVPFLADQFSHIAVHGEALAAHRGVSGDACACVHYQGIVRGHDSEGVPHMYLGRSGNDSGWCRVLCASFEGDAKPGELVVIRMSSRDRDGERLRSNLLKKQEDAQDDAIYNCYEPVNISGSFICTLAPEEDRGIGRTVVPEGEEEPVEISYYFDGSFPISEDFNTSPTYIGGAGPKYMHPGGMQMVGDVLAVALESPCDGFFENEGSSNPGDCNLTGSGKGAIILIDVRNPADAKILSIHVPDEDKGIYLVAATFVPQEDRYLFMWTSNDSDFHFGWSDTNDLFTTTDITKVETWNKSELGINKWGKWQTLNFVKSCSDPTQGCTEVDEIYLIGTDNNRTDIDEVLGGGEDWSRLFKVTMEEDSLGTWHASISYVAENHHKLSGPDMGDFDAAGGTYVSPSGQLILYSAPHDNGGLDGMIEMGELRNVNLRWESYLWSGEMFANDLCGGWVELYSDPGGWSHVLDSSVDRSLMFDLKDRMKDDWNDLDLYDLFFGDTASAVKYALVPGQTAWLFKHSFSPTSDGLLPGSYSADWPGKFIKLVGDGTVHTISNLDNWEFSEFDDADIEVGTGDGADDDISSVWIEDPPGFNTTELCDGLDNNCNGISDEGLGDDDKDGWGEDCDNCPYTPNPGQEDGDQDLQGDACDPVADANGPYTSECSVHGGAYVQMDGSGSYDPDEGLLTYDWVVGAEVASGVDPVVFVPLNTHNVELTVTDNHGNWDLDETTATVEDNQPPDITSVSATPDLLWPPNGKMVPVEVTVTVADACDAAPVCSIISIESNEPEGKKPDIEITGALTGDLRVERLGGGTGRVYTITVECADATGNTTTGTTAVTVPHDQR